MRFLIDPRFAGYLLIALAVAVFFSVNFLTASGSSLTTLPAVLLSSYLLIVGLLCAGTWILDKYPPKEDEVDLIFPPD